MKYAVIGTGYWGSNHARVAAELRDHGGIDEVILCDIDENRVREIANTYDVEYTTDYETLPERGVDAATIAVPAMDHYETASSLLNAGLDLLVEKPLTLESKSAWDLVNLAEEHDRTLGVGHIFRYHPALAELRERVERGEFGQLKYLNTTRYSERVPRESTGVLYSLAIHDVDVYRFLIRQSPDHVYCNMDCVIREGIDETTTLVCEYGDVTGVINASWQVPVFGKRRDLVVVGSEKAAYVDYLEDNTFDIHDTAVVNRGGTLRLRDEGSKTVEVDDAEPLKVEVETFLDARLGERDLPADGAVGAHAVELLERAVESANREAIVQL